MSQVMIPMIRRSVLTVLLAAGVAATASAAPAADQAADVSGAVEALRVAMVNGDEAALGKLVDNHLSYGHSNGVVQDKAAFIKNIAGPAAPGKFGSIALSKQSVTLVGHDAIVRHVFDSVNQSADGPHSAHLGVLQVWNQAQGHWVLIARQAFTLPKPAAAK